VTAFIGAPSAWGLLLRTIDVRPRQLTCITTSGQNIIAACGNIVNIYDAVTGVLQQSLSPSEAVRKIQASPDTSTLFFVHHSSMTMWDVQTGGLVHTFTPQSTVNDIAVSTSGGRIACGSSDGSVAFWDIRTRREGRSLPGNGQPVVAICWLSPQKLAVATQNSLYIHDVAAGKSVDSLLIPGCVWGMFYSREKDEFLVGTSEPGKQVYGIPKPCSLGTISHRYPVMALGEGRSIENRERLVRRKLYQGRWSPIHLGQLTHPVLVGKDALCITLPTGVQPFDIGSYNWTNKPPLLNAATSVAVSLNRNLVVQTKDSIQIFSTDVLMSGEVRDDTLISHVYPLGKNHIICISQPTRHIAVLELETLQEPRRDDETSPFCAANAVPATGLALVNPPDAEFDIQIAMRTWWLGIPLDEQVRLPDKDTPRLLYGVSPACTKIATVYGSTRRKLRINDTKHEDVLAVLRLKDGDLRGGEVYDLIFDSETSFYLKIDGPGQHVQIPCDITASPFGSCYWYTITMGEPIFLSKPRETPPYAVDANCEWVLDAQSRKICWIPPGHLRRENHGHFWVGLSLVMAGEDGVVRKLSFREPDC